MTVGELLIIGGAEDKCPEGEVLNKFVELAGWSEGRIGILPSASKIPDEVSSTYKQVFKELGVPRVEVIALEGRGDAENPVLSKQLASFTAVFITGGDQSRLAELIVGTDFHRTLTESWKSGMVLGGTSAGASIMGKEMIIAADMKLNDDKLKVEIGEGFGLLDGLLIDQHFSQRGRFDRLLSAIAENRDSIGIGIDENTAILVKDNQFEVYGQHQVLVLDGSKSDYIKIHTLQDGSEELTLSDFRLHALTRGYQFDLSERKLLKKGIQS